MGACAIAGGATIERGFEHTTTQVSVVQLGDVAWAGGVGLLEEVLTFLPSLSSRFGSTSDGFFGETIEVFYSIYEDGGGLSPCIHLIGELGLKDGDLAIDLLELLLVLGREECSFVDELIIEELGEA